MRQQICVHESSLTYLATAEVSALPPEYCSSKSYRFKRLLPPQSSVLFPLQVISHCSSSASLPPLAIVLPQSVSVNRGNACYSTLRTLLG